MPHLDPRDGDCGAHHGEQRAGGGVEEGTVLLEHHGHGPVERARARAEKSELMPVHDGEGGNGDNVERERERERRAQVEDGPERAQRHDLKERLLLLLLWRRKLNLDERVEGEARRDGAEPREVVVAAHDHLELLLAESESLTLDVVNQAVFVGRQHLKNLDEPAYRGPEDAHAVVGPHNSLPCYCEESWSAALWSVRG